MADVALGLNKGKVLMHLARHTYTTISAVVIECVQNAIDAEAKNVWIKIDMKRRNIVVSNDGVGVDLPQFEKALLSVGEGVKRKDKLGRFGLGLISPLDKCRRFTFTSKPAGDSKWLQWTFEASDIEPQSSEVRIPLRRLSHQKAKGYRHAVSHLSIYGFTKDRATVASLTPERLEIAIQEKLGPSLGQLGVSCYLDFVHQDGSRTELTIKPLEYRGAPIPVYRIDDPDAGEVVIELYVARRTTEGRQGRISISEMESTYPVTWNEFANSNRDLLTPELTKAFRSGTFEGIVRAEKIELHPSRNKFVRNNAALGLCLALEEWFEDTGHKVYTEQLQEHAERRYQQLGLKTLDRLDDLLHEAPYEHLREALRQLERGTIGPGHVPQDAKLTGDETEPGTRVGPGGAGIPKQPDGGIERPDGPQDPERPKDTPLVATGPNGRKRKVVRRNSGGLTFSYAMPEGSERLWEFDASIGVLYFNVRHPVWLKVEKKDHHILHLQEWIAIQALTTLLMPEASRDVLIEFVNEQARPYVDLVIIKGHLRNRS